MPFKSDLIGPAIQEKPSTEAHPRQVLRTPVVKATFLRSIIRFAVCCTAFKSCNGALDLASRRSCRLDCGAAYSNPEMAPPPSRQYVLYLAGAFDEIDFQLEARVKSGNGKPELRPLDCAAMPPDRVCIGLAESLSRRQHPARISRPGRA